MVRDFDYYASFCPCVRTKFIDDGQSLLFNGSTINTSTSWYSIMHYAVSNKLSYKAIEELIDLIKVCQ